MTSLRNLPPVTLVRLSGDEATTFAAISAADSLGVLAAWIDTGQDADTLPWTAVPGVEQLAAADLADRGRQSVALLGTLVDGEWSAWHVPCPKPAVLPEWSTK
jgi:hypothetical protein